MQSEVYLSTSDQSTRTIALRQSTSRADQHGRVLYFSLHNQPTANNQPKCAVRIEPASEFQAGNYRKLHTRGVYGYTFIALVTGCTKVGDIRMGESVFKIVAVRFFSLTGNTPDDDMIPVPYMESLNSFDSDNKGPSMMPHPCKDFEKVLCNGAFFFSPHFDLTRSVQSRTLKDRDEKQQSKISGLDHDESFLWNHFMLKEMLQFRSHLDEQDRVLLDAGGFLTETILSNQEWCFAYTQIRGSVPVFWEQQGLQLASHKIQISRGPEATKPAFRRHFEELVDKYDDVHVIDLLGTRDQGELTLSQEYRDQIQSIGQPLLSHLHMTRFDYHTEVKGGNYDQVLSLLQYVKNDSEQYSYFFHDLVSNSVIQTQRGVFRVNCLDCLDRTNVIQCNLSKEAVEYLLLNLQDQRFANMMQMHSELWASNGDTLSRIYTGTGALKSEVTRSGKMSFTSMLTDATKSINRFYINNFQDKDRQETIDFLLGKMANQVPVAIHDPLQDSIASEMSERRNEYSRKVQIDVFVGTYNLNGKAPSGESLESWLHFDKDIPEPDLFVIGFQEIVKLTPKQIMATDENKRIVWEKEVERTINRRGGARYIQLRSGQLVGAALMIYAKEHNVPHVRNLECSIKKTGMGGMAGNKGAVTVRMDYFDTSLCLITSHLASGQENLAERNNDYHTIDGGISFARGRSISSHDIVLWCGDFNYRVDMENDQIRALVSQGNYFEIYRCDQLRRSIDYDEAFRGYKEGIIAFAPSYRYDIGTDNYDTSEKYRAPAWTDRILYKGDGIYQTSYERAELRTSDHRPVMSMFVLELTVLDAEAKEQMAQTLYRKSSSRSLPATTIRPKIGASNLGLHRENLQNVLGIEYGKIQPTIAQKPSSETHQWWNDPLEDGVQRIASKNKNPFIGDKTIMPESGGASDRLARSTTMPVVRRQTPPPPPSASIKKPAIDLLGGKLFDMENFQAPVLGLSELAGARSQAPLNVKRSAPPPPAGRKFTPLPASSPVVPKDQIGSHDLRRPAPPPPKKSTVISQNNDNDDTDDLDTDDDSDDATDISVHALSSVSESQGKKISTSTIVEKSQSDIQKLLKPSSMKKEPPGVYGAKPPEAPVVSRGSKPSDNHHASTLRPSLSPSASVFSTHSTSSVGAEHTQSLATIAANKNKVLLPGAEVRSSGAENKKPAGMVPMTTSSVASLGLGSAGSIHQPLHSSSNRLNSPHSGLSPLKDIQQDGESGTKQGPSVSALKKTFGTAIKVTPTAEEHSEDNARTQTVDELKKSYGVTSGSDASNDNSTTLSVAVLTKSYCATSGPSKSLFAANEISPMAAAIAERKKGYGVVAKDDDDDDEKPEPTPSVSELKKSYGVSFGVGSTSTSNDQEPELSALPTVAALKKKNSTKGLITPQPATTVSASGHNGIIGSSSRGVGYIHNPIHIGPKMVKMAGMGSVETGSVLKDTLGNGVISQSKTGKIPPPTTEAIRENKMKAMQAPTNVKDAEVEDVMPASGSVKNAIASLKGANGQGSPVGTDSASKLNKEDEVEDEKVDAFAYWKSK
ncbi:inositol polyphosphate 5-phosphatase [Podila humilis]|nr:inositol polyphosphate 5-phosphatase [Podila humilis]